MPILLTTPFNPGAFDAGHTYPRAKIITFFHDTEKEVMRVGIDFGYEVNGTWESGAAENKVKTYTISGEAYDDMVAEDPDPGESVYDAVKRLLYEYLIEEVPELDGTIE